MYLIYGIDDDGSEYIDQALALSKQTGMYDDDIIASNCNIISWYMNADIDQSEYLGLTVSDMVYENKNIERVYFGYPNVSNCIFRNCRVYMTDIAECVMKDCVFENCTFICSAFGDDCTMINVTFNDCKFIDSEVCVDYRHRETYDEECGKYFEIPGLKDDPNHVEYNNCIHSYIVTEDPYC